jgi:Domain of unknown function (DUF4387)
MARLHELASLVRSKNAGPFLLTIDVLFDNQESYARVRDGGRINARTVAAIYNIPEADIRVFDYDAGRAIKVTFPRPLVSGTPGDPDVTGGQQYAPLTQLEV